MKVLSFLFLFIFSISALAINGRTTYQAKIIKPDGYPLEASMVNYRFTVLDPTGSCVLYIEDYANVNMNGSGGLISLTLGMGTKAFPVSGTLTFASVFDNATPTFNCQTPGAYNPVPTDNRKVVMQFNDGAGWQTLPAMAINAVPYAMYAAKSQDSQKLNGKADSAFVENATLASLNCNAATHAITFNGASFSCIAVGSGGGGGITGVTTSGTVLVTGGTASAPVISITAATMSQDGYLTAVDYAEFKAKLSASSTQLVSALGFAPVSSSAVAAQIDSSAVTSATANSIVKRDSSGNSSFSGVSANTASLNYIDIYKPSTSFNIRLQAPTSLSANYTLNLPTTSGTTGQVLSTDGSGNLSWINSATGSVTSVSGTANEITSSGGSNPTLGLANAGTAGTYYKVTTDSKGRVTSGVTTLTLSDLPNTILNTTSNFSGDISGMISNISVNRIQGVSITVTSLTANDVLQYDGSKYINKNIPTCAGTQYLTFNGTSFSCVADSGASGTITTISVTGPISSTGGANPTLSITQANSTTNGYLSSSDFNTFNNKQAATSAAIIATLGFTPADSATSGTYLQKSSNLSDLTNPTTARSNLGLGSFAVANNIDLGSASATGTLAIARIPAFSGDAYVTAASNTIVLSNSGVSAGTYTKVTVDAKGRVTSSSALASSDVTTALGYSPVSASAASQWVTSGSAISYSAGSVGIGTNSPNPSAALDISSTSTGLLLPRLTTAQRNAISSPANGLIVYDTDLKALFVYQVNLWKQVGGSTHEFRATQVSGTAVYLHGTSNDVVYINEEYDASNAYNNSTGTYTVPEDGTYIFTWAAYLANSSKITIRYSELWVDGVTKARSTENITTTYNEGATNGSVVLRLVAGQVVRVKAVASSSDSSNTPASANTATQAWNFSGARLGGSGGQSASDNLGNHQATQNINLATYQLVGNGGSAGISITNGGNVGIGTATPAAMLSVSGGLQIGYDLVCNALKVGTIRYNNSSLEFCNGSSFVAISSGASFTLDLGSASATGTLAIARIPAFTGDATIAAASNTIILSNSGVLAGTYSKVTVDGKGRVTSSSALALTDITTALGYTPANSATSVSSQWITSGPAIFFNSGDVGIGIVNPSSKLSVAGMIESTSGGIKFPDGTIQTTALLSSASGSATGTWVNFDGQTAANVNGTYSRTGTVLSVTLTNHGHLVGHYVSLTFTSGAATNGVFTVASVIDANTFTITHGTSGATSGNVTLNRRLMRGQKNVHSVTYNSSGQYYINFSSLLATVNLATVATAANAIGNFPYTGAHIISSAAAAMGGYVVGTGFVDSIYNSFIVSDYTGGGSVESSTSATATSSGYLTAADWNIFNSKLSTVDLSSTSATGTLSPLRLPAFSGDVSSSVASSTLNVIGLRGVSLSATAPVSGQILSFNGSQWIPTTIANLVSSAGSTAAYAYATIFKASTQTFAAVGTWYNITLDNEGLKQNITHSNTVNSERVQVVSSGLYKVTYSANFKGGSGTAGTRLLKNGTTEIAGTFQSAVVATTDHTSVLGTSVVVQLNAGDYLNLQGIVNSTTITLATFDGAPTTRTTAVVTITSLDGGSTSLAGGTAGYLPMWSSSSTLTNSSLFASGANIGIGTTTPSEKLEVSGAVKANQVCLGADCRSVWPSASLGVDVTTSTMSHFTSWAQASPPGASSPNGHFISNNLDDTYAWHCSPCSLPVWGGVDLGSGNAKTITQLKLQAHGNPLQNFILQASNDTTDGTNGTWTDLLNTTMTERTEKLWQVWNFTNTTSYRWYRVYVTSMYTTGWALYEWELVETNSSNSWLATGINLYNPNAGNVGIGTNNPLAKLDVVGNIAARSGVFYNSTSGNAAQTILSADTTAGTATANVAAWGASHTTYPGDVHLTNRGVGSTRFYNYNGSTWTESARFTSGGNLGIGTPTPAASLHLYAASATDTGLNIQNASAGGRLFNLFSTGSGSSIGAGKFAISDNSTPRFIIDPSGNVGIGAVSPTAKLEVAGTVKIVDGTQAVDRVLASDATGAASWQDAKATVILGTKTGGGIATNSSANIASVTLPTGKYLLSAAGTQYSLSSNGCADIQWQFNLGSGTASFLTTTVSSESMDNLTGRHRNLALQGVVEVTGASAVVNLNAFFAVCGGVSASSLSSDVVLTATKMK